MENGIRDLPRVLPLLAATACATPPAVTTETVLLEEQEVPSRRTAAVDLDDGADWLRLVSGEWIKGEVIVLDRDTLEFDSEELDDLSLDWSDIAEVHTTRPFTVLLDDQRTLTGALSVADGRATVRQDGQQTSFSRDDLFRMVPGEPREANYWSGDVAAGLTIRSGNTDQTDLTTSFKLMRRTANSRVAIDYNGIFSELEGTETANNTRLAGHWDVFVTPRFFVTPLGIEFFRDRFQNIELRTTPYAGVGYTFVDTKRLEWDGTLGAGYRITRFDSVAEGEDDKNETGTGIIGTRLESDLTSDIELDVAYSAQIGFDDVENTNQDFNVVLSVDLWGDLELDVSFDWTRIGQPEVDDDGNRPEKDDLRTMVGLSWEF